MKNTNISTEYILMCFEKSTNVECVYKFGTKGHIICKLYFCRQIFQFSQIFLFDKVLKCKETTKNVNETYVKILNICKCQRWFKQFKNGDRNLKNQSRNLENHKQSMTTC